MKMKEVPIKKFRKFNFHCYPGLQSHANTKFFPMYYIHDPLSKNLALPTNIEFELEAILFVTGCFPANTQIIVARY